MDREDEQGLFASPAGSASAGPAVNGAEPARLEPDESRTAAGGGSPAAERRSRVAALLATLERMERALAVMQAALDAARRADTHREFSPARLIGAGLQALVVGLVLWALSDWAFGEPPTNLFIKLAFAAVLQLAALTAFLLGREVV